MLNYIKSLLENSSELKPIPTDQESKISRIKAKAVLFDIYGTLLISSSGDTLISSIVRKQFIEHSHKFGIIFKSQNDELILKTVMKEFQDEIKNVHLILRNHGHPYPEVDIIEIWRTVIEKLIIQDVIETSSAIHYKEFAFVFELDSNPVYPMPNMKTILMKLKEKYQLGIISNAQFYTPMLMNFFISGKLKENIIEDFFQDSLQFYSYKNLRAKPDIYLYELAAKQLMKKGIYPHEVLYIGNDMLKDVWAAQQVGFKTALYAGDKRSLRMRKQYDLVNDCVPDLIITDLTQLCKILEV